MFRFFGLILAIVVSATMLLCFGSALSDIDFGENVKKSMFGVDVSGGAVKVDSDTHGGFHGDGERFLVLDFYDGSVREAVSELWQPLPANEEIAALIWGTEENSGRYIDADIPKIETGWYFFEDTGPAYGFNFTFAVYDADTDRLYYVKRDM